MKTLFQNFLGSLLGVLVGLKISDVIHWSWWIVTAPLLGYLAVRFVALIISSYVVVHAQKIIENKKVK